MVRSSSDAPPPPDSAEDLAGAEVRPPRDVIIEAARRLVVGVFDTVTAELPQLIRAQAPPGNPVPNFTADMVEQLQAQLRRALGLGPEDAGPKDAGPKDAGEPK